MPMAGDSPSLKQDDIEELLRQAHLASGLVPEGSAADEAASHVAAAAAHSTATQSAPSAAATATLEQPILPRSDSGSQNVGDDVQYLLAQAEQAIASVTQPVEVQLAGLAPFELKDLAGAPASGE